MIASMNYSGLADVASHLPAHGGTPDGSALTVHPFFGALFVFLGSILIVELLAGNVWRRSVLRRLMWPGALVLMGLALVLVSVVQSTDKTLHFTLAVLFLSGGLMEGRYQLGQIPRRAANAFAIPAFIVGGLVIGPLHVDGVGASASAQAHLLVGVSGWALAGVKLAQLGLRRPVSLDYTFGFGVMVLGLSLLLVEQFHHAH